MSDSPCRVHQIKRCTICNPPKVVIRTATASCNCSAGRKDTRTRVQINPKTSRTA